MGAIPIVGEVGSLRAPGMLSEEEETRYASAPMKGDKRIFWDHISWRSCPSGHACSFAHSMIQTNHLHWIIRADLDKSGGHRSDMRIAPGAVPGYITTLRETNASGDGEEKPKHPHVWRNKVPKPHTMQADRMCHLQRKRLIWKFGLFLEISYVLDTWR